MFHKPAIEDAEPVIEHPGGARIGGVLPPLLPLPVPPPLPLPEPPPEPLLTAKLAVHAVLTLMVMVHVGLVPQDVQPPPQLTKT